MIALGFTVQTRRDRDTTTGNATGKALVVLSASAFASEAGSDYRNVAIPVIAFDSEFSPRLAMTAGTEGRDYGHTADATRITVVAAHTLATNLTGTRTVMANSRS